MCKDGTFLGFILYTPVDTSICPQFKLALSQYSGPTVRVNSLKRHFNCKSDHYRGKAVDLELSHELIEWLVSLEGRQWLESNRLMFYIEGKPGSKKVANYLNDDRTSKFVFFNPRATGNHVHIEES